MAWSPFVLVDRELHRKSVLKFHKTLLGKPGRVFSFKGTMNRSIGSPAGFRDILYEEAATRRSVEGKLAGVFASRQYREIIPPGVELLSVYERGNQNIAGRTFRFLDTDDTLLALRADFTPAIARIVSTRFTDADLPARLWYSGNVFRKVPLNRGLFRETTQIGAELLGVNSPASDAEVIRLAVECLKAAGVNDVQLHINHAGIFAGIVETLGLPEAERAGLQSEILRKDWRNLLGRMGDMGMADDLARQFDLLSRSIGSVRVLDEVAGIIDNQVSRKALNELRALAALLGDCEELITFDLTEIDELEYYTGVMFTFFSPMLNRELGRGGRYDDLLTAFGKAMPAVGFSFSMDVLTELQ